MKFSLWKQVKKRLRRAKKPVLSLGTMLLVAYSAALLSSASAAAAVQDEQTNNRFERMTQEIASDKQEVNVVLRRQYICGEEFRPLGLMAWNEVIEVLRAHPEWTVHFNEQNDVQFEEQVNDLSAKCKQNAFISMDKQGNLSLFDGPPKKEKVVRTFYQVDVPYMESSLPKNRLEELADGIRVTDLAEFNSVLSTYSEYALPHKSEEVMKRTP
ncbi:hypothetical protein EBB07_00410 [Paenibacillaceae bacterium]|nr:hypothetical protein EBB07_00410 [Paenibacillaceae bacterium]